MVRRRRRSRRRRGRQIFRGGGKEDCKSRRPFLVGRSIHSHGYGWIVVFEAWEVIAPNFASAEVSIVDFAAEIEVYSFGVLR